MKPAAAYASPIPASVQTSPETSRERRSRRDLACRCDPMGQRQAASDRAHPAGEHGQRDVDAAEEQHEEVGEIRREEEILRAQSDRAEQHSEARARRDRHHEDRGEGGHRVEAGAEPEQQGARAERERRDEQSVQQHRHAPAEEDRGPVGRRSEQRPERPEPALVRDGHGHAVDGRHGTDLHRVADDVEVGRLRLRVLAELGEEDQLEERAAEHRRDVHRRPDPVEETAVRDQATDEEDREPLLHVRARVARARAAVSNQRNV